MLTDCISISQGWRFCQIISRKELFIGDTDKLDVRQLKKPAVMWVENPCFTIMGKVGLCWLSAALEFGMERDGTVLSLPVLRRHEGLLIFEQFSHILLPGNRINQIIGPENMIIQAVFGLWKHYLFPNFVKLRCHRRRCYLSRPVQVKS